MLLMYVENEALKLKMDRKILIDILQIFTGDFNDFKHILISGILFILSFFFLLNFVFRFETIFYVFD